MTQLNVCHKNIEDHVFAEGRIESIKIQGFSLIYMGVCYCTKRGGLLGTCTPSSFSLYV